MPLLAAFLMFWIGCAGPLQTSRGGPTIRVAVQKEPLKILELPLERYLVGVLAKEMGNDWPLEALKAQSVASRTYALSRKESRGNSPYDVEASVADQVFEDRKEYPEILIRAVNETRGEILNYGGKLFAAFYHSSCGGMSQKASAVWGGNPFPPLEEIHSDPFCEESPRSHWEYRMTDTDLKIVSRDESGRVARLIDSTGNEIKGEEFRKRTGYDTIRSTLFTIENGTEEVVLKGHGSGHGVGLCQWGAKGMAEWGFSYRDILEFYYPGAAIANLPL